ELSTPLSTMSALLKDLHADNKDPQIQEDLELLQEQVRQCKASLQQMVRSAEFNRNQPHSMQAADSWLHGLLERWQLMRPEVSCRLEAVREDKVLGIKVSTERGQSILTELYYVADACPDNVEVGLEWDGLGRRLCIREHGPGVPLHIAAQLGTALVTT